MNKIKCAQCGLVNWSTEVECKRCKSLLTVQEKTAAYEVNFDSLETRPFFSAGLKFLVGILGLATLVLLFSRVFQLLSVDLAVVFSLIFMLIGMLLLLLTHIWLLVRIFEQSLGWGLGALFIPFVILFAVANFWEKTKRSFIGQLVSMAIMMVAALTVPPSVLH